MTHRKQLTVFFGLILTLALCAFITYAFFIEKMSVDSGLPLPDLGVPSWVLGLINFGIILVVYSVLGLAGYWFARKLGLPGIYSPDGNWRRWFLIPGVVGLLCGVVVVIVDVLFAPINGIGRFQHPAFPVSILASITAGIGEEILFRGFVFGVWSFILNWLFKRFQGRTAALWIANVIAAVLFAASHLSAVFILTGATSIADLSPILLLEGLLLNGIIGIIAGQRYMKDGLVAAAGVHFWTDVVFHVIWGVIGYADEILSLVFNRCGCLDVRSVGFLPGGGRGAKAGHRAGADRFSPGG